MRVFAVEQNGYNQAELSCAQHPGVRGTGALGVSPIHVLTVNGDGSNVITTVILFGNEASDSPRKARTQKRQQ